MPGGSKAKKNARSFRSLTKKVGATHFDLGHRSQKDPMLADSEASEHVLVPRESGPREKQWEEQIKYGIYYEDDYDYLQHLRDVKEIQDCEMLPSGGIQLKEEMMDDDTRSVSMASTTMSRLTLPGSVLGSTVERDVGLLDMQAESREDWDPEVMAALEDDFGFDDPDNVLDDDFMQKANADVLPIEEEDEGDEDDKDASQGDDDEEGWEDTESGEEEEEEEEKPVEQSDAKVKGVSEWIQKMQLEGAGDDDDEDEGSDFGLDSDDNISECSRGVMGRKPTVSKYSASMNPRNENLQFIDRLHEALLKREYSEDQMGALDGEKLGGRCTFDGDWWKQMAENFYKSQEKVTMKDLFNSKEKVRPVLPERYYYVEEKDYSVEKPVDYSQKPLVTTQKPLYDCETAPSSYSGRKYLPTPIVLPEHMLPKKEKKKKERAMSDAASESAPGLTLRQLHEQSQLERQADVPNTFRPRHETAEEKKARKKEVKAMQRERRAEKKESKTTFRESMAVQKKVDESKKSQKRQLRT